MSPTLKAQLIQGAFICPSSDSPSYEKLKGDGSFRHDVAAWLEDAGFFLASTSGGSAYYACIRYANPREHGAEILSQFKDAYVANAFVRNFMDLIRASADASVEFKSGELLRGADIYQAIDASEAHTAKLRKQWSKLGKKNKNVNDHQMMIDILDHLAEDGYLICESKANANYRVCGKIEHMFDLIDYAIEHSSVSGGDEPQPTEDALSAAAQEPPHG